MKQKAFNVYSFVFILCQNTKKRCIFEDLLYLSGQIPLHFVLHRKITFYNISIACGFFNKLLFHNAPYINVLIENLLQEKEQI